MLYFGKNRQKSGFFEGKTSNQDNFVLNFVKNVDLFYILGASNLLSDRLDYNIKKYQLL